MPVWSAAPAKDACEVEIVLFQSSCGAASHRAAGIAGGGAGGIRELASGGSATIGAGPASGAGAAAGPASETAGAGGVGSSADVVDPAGFRWLQATHQRSRTRQARMRPKLGTTLRHRKPCDRPLSRKPVGHPIPLLPAGAAPSTRARRLASPSTRCASAGSGRIMVPALRQGPRHRPLAPPQKRHGCFPTEAAPLRVLPRSPGYSPLCSRLARFLLAPE